MNRGVMQSSPVQAAGNPNWWNITTMLPPSHPFAAPPLPTTTTNNFTSLIPQSPFPFSPLPCWPLDSDYNPTLQPPIPAPDSWTHLFMGGLASEEHHQDLEHVIKQHNSSCGFVFGNNNNINNNNIMGNSTSATPTTTSPQSCITTFSSTTTANSDPPPPPAPPMPDLTPECNGIAGSVKKAKVQSTATQSTFKVRKFGDRITALHQLVSPFGKTDTASVLLEAIGYIRFLHSQVEALSLPYLSSGSGNNKRQKLQQHPQSGEEPRKDLRSKGLSLVPVSWTSEVGRDNGADYWAPVLSGFR